VHEPKNAGMKGDERIIEYLLKNHIPYVFGIY
jgi:hypothetical protein